MKVEHEYERLGALNLFAAFDTRTGQVWGQTYERKRQVELIAFLEYLDNEIPAHITQIHVVLDNLRMHKGKKVQARESPASPICLPLPTRPLLLDESSRTMVQYSPTQAVKHRQFQEQASPCRAFASIHC
jgi:hypothetical protein